MSRTLAQALGSVGPENGLRSDQHLARSSARGDDDAFAALYSRYHAPLVRYAVAILGPDGEAPDAVQSAMVKALSHLRSKGAPENVKPWLYRIVHNEAINLIRARVDLADETELQSLPNERAQRSVEARAVFEGLLGDLRLLPERQRSALVLRELAGFSCAEIGVMLGISPDSAKQAIYEARCSLQEMARGRDLDCADVQQAISARDGRRLRARNMRSHLAGCAACVAFKGAISVRRAELQAIPVPPLAAGAVLAAAGSGAGAGAGAGLGAGAAGATTAGSGVATVTVAKLVAVVGVGSVLGVGVIVAKSDSSANGDVPDRVAVTAKGQTHNPHGPGSHEASDGPASSGSPGRDEGSGASGGGGRGGSDSVRDSSPEAGSQDGGSEQGGPASTPPDESGGGGDAGPPVEPPATPDGPPSDPPGPISEIPGAQGSGPGPPSGVPTPPDVTPGPPGGIPAPPVGAPGGGGPPSSLPPGAGGP
jgi:RNA polymerase sigma factor (sigma-70 family)